MESGESSYQRGSMLINKFFANANVCKLFFGMRRDLHKIAISLPGCEHLTKSRSQSNIVDLLWVYTKMRDGNSHLFPYPGIYWVFCLFSSYIFSNIKKNTFSLTAPTNIGKIKGLSKMISRCFGAPLNESHRKNWERRPLFPCQVSYAGSYVRLVVTVSTKY